MGVGRGGVVISRCILLRVMRVYVSLMMKTSSVVVMYVSGGGIMWSMVMGIM